VKSGVIIDPSTPGKHVTYGQLVEGRRIERHIQKVPVKPVAAFTISGQSPRRKDALAKVTGKARFAGDISIPGMLHARILRPPAHGATLKEANTSAAETVAGARVVKDGELIAVLHERRDLADKALGLVKAQFNLPKPSTDDRTIFEHLTKTAPPLSIVDQDGNLAEGEKLAATVVDATYLNSYVAHATIETHSAIATIEGSKTILYVSTQSPFIVKQAVAQALGFDPRNVRIIAPYVGGAFGGKSDAPQAVEAARLAKLTGKPVRVVWSREEEFFFDAFRPAAVIKIHSGLTSAGKIAL
jgi:CO/xanthine dehydrogenase Mo-binding subunit